jgi:hypothetical protein
LFLKLIAWKSETASNDCNRLSATALNAILGAHDDGCNLLQKRLARLL